MAGGAQCQMAWGRLPAVEDHERGGRLVQSGLHAGLAQLRGHRPHRCHGQVLPRVADESGLAGRACDEPAEAGGVRGGRTAWRDSALPGRRYRLVGAFRKSNFEVLGGLAGSRRLRGQAVGRWQPSTDEAYVRSIRGNVEKAQKMMAEEIRNNLGGPDKLDEESIMDKVVEKLAGQEVDANDVEDQKLRLTSFQGGIFASILGKDSWQASEKDPLEIVEVEDGDEASKNEETASEPDRTPEGYKGRYFASLRRTLHQSVIVSRGCTTSGLRTWGRTYPRRACTTGCARSASLEVSRRATSRGPPRTARCPPRSTESLD